MCKVEYRRFAPPFAKPAHLMTGREAAAFFEFFLSQIPERLSELARYAAGTGGPPDVRPNPEILAPLGKWLNGHVATQSMSTEERAQLAREAPEGMMPFLDKRNLTEDTLSLCVDIAMLMGETMRAELPALHWEYVRKPKNNVDFQYPVLAPMPGRVAWFSPIAIMQVVVWKALDGVDGEVELPRAYAVWRDLAARTDPPAGGR